MDLNTISLPTKARPTIKKWAKVEKLTKKLTNKLAKLLITSWLFYNLRVKFEPVTVKI
jgi:hypothetical protein